MLIEPVVSKNTNALKAHAIMAGLDRAINAGSTFYGAQLLAARCLSTHLQRRSVLSKQGGVCPCCAR